MYVKIFVNILFTVFLFSSVTDFVVVWAPRVDVPAIKRSYSLVSAGGRQAVLFW